VIDTVEKLEAFLPELRAAKWIALDTEADSLHAYPEKLCLIQVSVEGSDRLVDPLSKTPLESFFQILGEHELILHGADYDLRLLRRDCGFVPGRIFDTMLAARLLGCREFGLGSLVSKFEADLTNPFKVDGTEDALADHMRIKLLYDLAYCVATEDLRSFLAMEIGIILRTPLVMLRAIGT